MNQIDLMKELHVPSDKKIVLLVMDGLGGLPGPSGKTELRHGSKTGEESGTPKKPGSPSQR